MIRTRTPDRKSVPRRPVTVLHILGSLDRGGAETRLIDTLRALPRSAVKSEFLLLSGRAGDLAPTASRFGASIHVDHLSPGLPWRYWRLLRSRRPDVVHAHVHYSSGIFLFLAALLRIRHRIAHFRSVTDVRPGQREGHRRRVQRWVGRVLIDKCATDIVGVSGSVLSAQWRHSDPRARVIYNGFAIEPPVTGTTVPHHLHDSDSGPLLVQVGRLDELKNQEFTVRVLAEVRRQLPNARLQLVGRGDPRYEERIRRQIGIMGLEGAVDFLGVRGDVREQILPVATTMVHPTQVEGLPGAVIEAIAVGTPVVASDIPPNREVAQWLSGITLVALDASPRQWADAVIAMVGHAEGGQLRANRLVESFGMSPFCMSTHVRQMLTLWGACSDDDSTDTPMRE